jgi:predicted molibdopterin-dependent oxidoreductase YjgC
LRPDCYSCTACVNACEGKNLMRFGVKRAD